jgi:hypothetical protein
MTFVRAKFIGNDCEDCLKMLLEESKSFGGLPLGGNIVEIPEHWLNAKCTHGCSGLKFHLDSIESGSKSTDVERMDAWKLGIELSAYDPGIDATKNIGYPIREHGPYGSHPMHDDFDDESGPDGSGAYKS